MTSVVTIPSEIVFAFFALITLVIVMRLMLGLLMISGVYLTNDCLIEEAPKLSVEDEKTALKKRLTELEEQYPSS